MTENIKKVIDNDNYLLCVDNLNHIYNRLIFDKYLKKFVNKCNKYNIDFYDKIDDKYYIYKKEYIILQINIFKKYIVQRHIDKLSNFIEKNNLDFESNDYLELNNKIIAKNKTNLYILNKLLILVGIIYEYNLLEIGEIKNYNTDYEKTYDNIVNLSNIGNEYLKYINNGIIIIDDYSTDKN
jgi:hypothetical protein